MSHPLPDEAAIKRKIAEGAVHFHPLEMIPYFRRFPYSHARDFIYTFIWNTLLGVAFMVVGTMFTGKFDLRTLRSTILISNCIGYSIHVLFMGGALTGLEARLVGHHKLMSVAYYTVMATGGVILGMAIASVFYGWTFAGWLARPSVILGIAVNCLVISVIIAMIFFWREKTLLSEMLITAERERAATIEREATLANLRALQAQIEPHFLFNTLANVVSLIQPKPEVAKHMLEEFIAYLRASLASTRSEETTLQQEFALMRRFLAILQIRMGERLVVETHLPDDLGGLSLPSMLIQPLVENAIKHGLEPKMEGGKVTLSASRDGGRLCICVADTGLGFTGATSSGIGLKNVRERLEKLFDGRASLAIEENQPAGTRAVLWLPLP